MLATPLSAKHQSLLVSMKATSRARKIEGHLSGQRRTFGSYATAMAGFDINSRYRMNSGHDIPVLVRTPIENGPDLSLTAVC